ncbi:M20/M25/M40 family metallo-hydrolase [Maridesulfovibrio ferrireducens]|uniref:M20/M25/M40 family metallo-hydrolase n=1 Tax=Maridesulfovibrio ferrireducens TaxID=246191 RepID=UPI001A2A3AEA|nr:M20/M25/M40 family metallo-hydrolase [Maridesulfovibrio ferrireducens]MBI9111441.1 M20/M25/M40 family metallo-hydrolase [Maridesulfovibrio ferrireducens]
MINKDRILSLFLDLVKIDSPSLKEKNVADYLCSLMQDKGYEIIKDNAGKACGGNTGNIFVQIPATGDGDPIAFSAHMDCVNPCCGVVPVVKDDVVYSSGDTVLGGDDKAGLAIMIEALKHLEEESIPHPEIYLMFSICEESGMHGAKNMDATLLPAKNVIVLDSGGAVGTIVIKAPAKAGIKIVFKGKSAHAGITPESGISAIQIAAEAVTHMNLLRIDKETTANLGSIEGGGSTNIVTEQVTLSAEARSTNEESLQSQLDHMKKCCVDAADNFGGACDFDYEISYPALHVDESSMLLAKVEQSCKNISLSSSRVSTGGGSDSNILYGKGYDVLTLGIGMSKVHTVEEFIKIKSMTDCAELVADIMKS